MTDDAIYGMPIKGAGRGLSCLHCLFILEISNDC